MSTIEEGRQAYIAVASRNGPHVTPELYAWSGDALWLAVASTTLKAKVVRSRSTVGAAVIGRDRTVLLQGDAVVLDVRDIRAWPAHLAGLPTSLRAVGHFTVRNAPDLLAFVRDAATGRLGWRLPSRRILLRLTPDRFAVAEGGSIVDTHGWNVADRPEPVTAPAAGTEVVVGIPGPLVVPGRWLEEDMRLFIPPAVLELADGVAGSFPVGIVVDEYTAPGPAAKQGTLLRGRAHPLSEPGVFEVEPERTVAWIGVETSTGRARESHGGRAST